ncbi:MAG: sigma-70 family RNA polymerase sigma factor [Pseudomonadota bacterium]
MSKQTDLYDQAGREFAASLARLARAVERDRDKARDLEQEIHAAVWSSLARFEGQCALKTWVYRVAHNVAGDHVRAAARRPKRVPLEDIGELPSPENPERQTSQSLVLGKVRALIRQLPFPDSQVMLLWLEGESTKAIAEVTGLSPSAVGVRVHRIKRLLAAHFEDPAPEAQSNPSPHPSFKENQPS